MAQKLEKKLNNINVSVRDRITDKIIKKPSYINIYILSIDKSTVSTLLI